MKPGSIQYEAMVFDMDGVIFDSERAVIGCWIELAEKYGFQDIEKACLACTGTTMARTREIMLEIYGQDFPYDKYKKEMSDLFHANAAGGKLPKKPGIRELLEYLRRENIKTAVASSTRRDLVTRELEEGGLLSYFDEIVCGDMVSRSKPEPDIYLEACRRLQERPEDCYAIEDSYNGIRSAKRAGMHPIMVPDQAAPTEEMEELADSILPSLHEVQQYIDKNCKKI